MASSNPASSRISPSYNVPGKVIQRSQTSMAFAALGGAAPAIQLDSTDLYVYLDGLRLTTAAKAAQGGGATLLPSASIVTELMSASTYKWQVRTNYSMDDVAMAARRGYSLPDALRIGNRQALSIAARDALLYGTNPGNNEGLLNAPGAASVTLPPDSGGASTFSTYDNGEFAEFILNQIVALDTNTYSSGRETAGRIVIVGPQRILTAMAISRIVQLTNFQRIGAGTSAIAQLIALQAKEGMAQSVEFAYDDSLIGKGAGGSDMLVMTMPEYELAKDQAFNTNAFEHVMPGFMLVNTMYADMANPKEITVPIASAYTDVLTQQVFTSGMNIRPEGLRLLSVPY